MTLVNPSHQVRIDQQQAARLIAAAQADHTTTDLALTAAEVDAIRTALPHLQQHPDVAAETVASLHAKTLYAMADLA